ncbi:MAG TPA: CAP domain-containing protein, partial [Solirubrobacteraceae bacterium]|nr:CAP domain-containing protein [Solirubrobacteraceae bacterium]
TGAHRQALPAPVAAGACANAGLAAQADNLPRVAAAVLCLINEQRAGAGLRPLRENARLAGAARRHSDDMARSRTFDHVGSAGDTFATRIAASGYLQSGRAVTAGENIAWVPARRSTAGAMVADWMSSADHRANILDPGFRDTGIGLSLAPPSGFTGGGPGATVTEDFGALH